MTENQRFLQLAVEIAVDNVRYGNGGPYGAVIVRNGEIITTGVNCVTSQLDPTAHAEVVAIRRACAHLQHFELQNCTLYSSCEPCPMCLGAIYWARLEKVFFACDRAQAAAAEFDDSLIYDELAKPAANRLIPCEGLAIPNAGLPFEAWIKKTDKIKY